MGQYVMIERLEIRRLLAVVPPGPGVHYDAETMKVHVTGTAGNDVITVVRRDNRRELDSRIRALTA